MAGPNDGTQLGTSEVISDEYIDPNQLGRRDPNVIAIANKVPRSKIAIGPFGQDWGDAAHDQPLPVESRAARQYAELSALRERGWALEALAKSAAESVVLMDSRGHHITNRGTR